MASLKRLQKEYQELLRKPYNEFSFSLKDDNLYLWELVIFGPQDTPYEGGIFKAIMTFPKEYPNKPPELKFESNVWHPNVYPDGRVCISILHQGQDQFGYEDTSERWKPVHGVASVIMSIISMLSDPNDESPANVEAAIMWRKNYADFKKRVYKCVELSYE
ncbi:Ubiquitin-conjugating enzyme [seawater metagenome]|uniref:Ubiquitin-conjugating enzyme n=1 Tax=seawater metagenome TaxID=1561972 RepID=A0A5E8CL26_9ZZZZ